MDITDDQTSWVEDDLAVSRERDMRGATRAVLLLLMVGWVAAASAAFLLAESVGARFLDMPLAAYLAGQGALIALVLVSVRLIQHRDG